MRQFTDLQEKLTSEAEFGFYYFYGKITKKIVTQLRNEGFTVTDSLQSKGYPRLHKIDWSNATVNYESINDLNENDACYSLPQKLWIISTKNKLYYKI